MCAVLAFEEIKGQAVLSAPACCGSACVDSQLPARALLPPHRMHRGCIQQSVKHKAQCPVCKAKVGRRELRGDGTMDRVVQVGRQMAGARGCGGLTPPCLAGWHPAPAGHARRGCCGLSARFLPGWPGPAGQAHLVDSRWCCSPHGPACSSLAVLEPLWKDADHCLPLLPVQAFAELEACKEELLAGCSASPGTAGREPAADGDVSAGSPVAHVGAGRRRQQQSRAPTLFETAVESLGGGRAAAAPGRAPESGREEGARPSPDASVRY